MCTAGTQHRIANYTNRINLGDAKMFQFTSAAAVCGFRSGIRSEATACAADGHHRLKEAAHIARAG